MNILSITILSLFLIGTLTGVAYAQSTYTINIPTGAADKSAPYFWQNEKDGSTTGIIEIVQGDTVKWSNADTAKHTITSGVKPNLDGTFNEIIGPGESFPFTFHELGSYPYFCTLYPWMVGEVIVTEGMSILPGVGKLVTDGQTSFDVEYRFNRLLSNASINVDQKSITFEIRGNAKSSDHNLYLKLPPALLDGPYVIWVNGIKLDDFEHTKQNDMNILQIPLTEKSQVLTIIGTHVVPEFGIMTVVILAIAITSIVAITQKNRFLMHT